ncbi:class I SAM-dependent methyltransferase [Thalassomonas actiniarum]|uniref:Methyltransferase domain-containing protein n=1 Tax=Thalassomonas actiniarum TaxID=485447 RepID=A0AAF0C562_9GAMM|nr:class I SAM-dependent methyltransferase [Thalassomonas actiniarum]WDE00734.1 methyltransferase domain-containing protein [Thalassomonas actiniarum]
MTGNIQFYNDNARHVAQQYLSKFFEEIHAGVLAYVTPVLNKADARILDIGAGAGRDAKYLAEQGQSQNVSVTAVEPAKLLADIGKQHTQNLNVNWLEDSLPALAQVTRQEVSFDLILLSAVWMHIPESDRARSIRKLANLLKPGGKLVISLRHSQTEHTADSRKMYAVCADELKQLAKKVGLFTVSESQRENDKLGREEVSWQTVVFQLPDDGSGAFPFIRHVATNDGKSATHKLALLRVLLRIADGHPGAVLRRESSLHGDRVILPAGLVALYWCHQYKDLIDKHQLFQTPNKSPNMGFMKPNGWHKLTHRTAADYRIGHMFSGDDAIALHKTLSDALSNIKGMPCKYITLPNSEQGVFEVASKQVRAKDSIFLDLTTLTQWGEFSLPEHIWLAFNRYACWIEPVLVSEWVNTMLSYKGNARYQTVEKHYVLQQALNWLEPKRSTIEIRQRFEQLQQQQTQYCVWTAKTLKQKYNIDHCMPFARWPNNDLWNLLPADSQVNHQKSDRLPSEKKLKDAKERMLHWWQSAWLDDSALEMDESSVFLINSQRQRFFAEANIALPGLKTDNSSVDDLFEALVMHRGRLKEMQQLREW